MSGGGDFWSRRKAKVREAEEADQKIREEERRAAEVAAREEKTDEEILEELDLPDPDRLKAGDDFARFMSAAVPERIRRKALRRLWLSNPVLANLDGLVDYADDYAGASGVTGNLQTVYQVGKGILAPVRPLADADDAQPGETTDTAGNPAGKDHIMNTNSDDAPASGDFPLTEDPGWVQSGAVEDGLTQPEKNESNSSDDEENPRQRGRMRFSYL